MWSGEFGYKKPFINYDLGGVGELAAGICLKSDLPYGNTLKISDPLWEYPKKVTPYRNTTKHYDPAPL